MTQVFGNQDVSTTDNDFNVMSFVFWMLMAKVQTCTLVKVLSCTNDGGVSAVGRVTVQPLVNQMTGNRQPVSQGTIYNALYSRISTSDGNAIIMDPTPGTIGLMAFCSRDISGVVANEGQANPGSFRMFDWADGIFCMGVPLGITPTQYALFAPDGGGITLVSPSEIVLQAPTVVIDASTQVVVNSPETGLSGNMLSQGTVTGDVDVVANGISGAGHKHIDTQPGSGESGPPAT